MDRIPVELIYLVLIAGFVLFNWLTEAAAQRRRQEEQAQVEEAETPGQYEPEPPAFEPEPVEYRWGNVPARVPEPAPAPAPVSRPAPAVAAPSSARRLHPVRALLKDKPSLRRAVILSMVLGPCRAQEPPDQR